MHTLSNTNAYTPKHYISLVIYRIPKPVREKVYTILGGGNQLIFTFPSIPSHILSNTNAYTLKHFILAL